jgi:hypothetical protein
MMLLIRLLIVTAAHIAVAFNGRGLNLAQGIETPSRAPSRLSEEKNRGRSF